MTHHVNTIIIHIFVLNVLRLIKTTRFQHNNGLIPLFHTKHTNMAKILLTSCSELFSVHACANTINYGDTVRMPTCNRRYGFSAEQLNPLQMYVPLKLNINTFLGLTGFADACSLKKYMYLLFVRTTVTTIIITVIKIKPKIQYIILQALGITFTLFSHLTNTRTQKETRSLVLC